jgi:hypothetical protein
VTPKELGLLFAAPGLFLLLAGAVVSIAGAVTAAPPGSGRLGYRLMALGAGVCLDSMALWLLFVAPQPLWLKIVAATPAVLLSLPFLGKARRPPSSVI